MQLVGCWKESSKSELNTDHQVHELVFTDNGDFSVAWYTFEVYKDYWGSYEYDNNTGAALMKVAGGNYVPANLDLNGSAGTNSDKELLLFNMYLGHHGAAVDFSTNSKNYTFTKC